MGQDRVWGYSMKVLIAVEESECSRRALQSVLDRTWPANCQFRLVNVFEPIPPYGTEMYTPHAAEAVIQAEREFLQLKKDRLAQDIAQVKNKFADFDVSGEVLTGDVRRSIIEEANAWGADLIILGSHGRKGFSKLLLGSVAEGVAGHADCSVEIVKEKKPL